ncbi:MAG: LPS-assembly protein LptD [Bdellovibrionota bacterium]
MRKIFFCLVVLCLVLFTKDINIVSAIEVEAPSNRYLFKKDTKQYKKEKKRKIKQIISSERPVDKALDFNSPNIEFLQDANQVRGSGGVIISHYGMGAQSDVAVANLKTKDAILFNDVLFTMDEASITAREADFNFDSEKGSFSNSELVIEEGNYKFSSDKLKKVDDDNFEASKCAFSSCHCLESKDPWSIKADNLKITREGYARGWNASFNLNDVPVVYLPYVAFPVKQERSSGLLIPEFSHSSKDGFGYKQPVFFALTDQTDITISPFVQTKTRAGSAFDFRTAFSERNNVKSRFYFSDESSRDGDLRGLDVSGMTDPNFDENRFAAFYNQAWTSKKGASIPTTLVSDIHYASDDLFIREIEDNDIGESTSSYLTSKVALTTSPLDFLVAGVSSEYNQAMYTDDDLVFQRLPEFTVNSLNNFRPFGHNPYGLKLVFKNDLSATNFSRKEGYEGWRTSLIPSIKMPFHYKNYFDSAFQVSYNYANYSLSEKKIPGSNISYDEQGNSIETDVFKEFDSGSRSIPIFDYKIGTGVEKVYNTDEDSILARLTTLGADNSGAMLKRLKNTIEPSVSYKYVPDVDQDDLPYFDSNDRMRKAGVVTYQVKTSLFGRYMPRYAVSEKISELTPELKDLPLIDTGELGSLGEASAYNMPRMDYTFEKGSIRELMAFTLKQSYDHTIDEEIDGTDNMSDIEADLDLYFSNYFATKLESNIDNDSGSINSYGISAYLKDDRGDVFKLRYSFLDDVLEQLEGNIELAWTDRFRTGYYTRYDVDSSDFIEQQIAFRIMSACDCWHIDLGLSDKTNPDRKKVILSFALGDLGGLTQSFGVGNDTNR